MYFFKLCIMKELLDSYAAYNVWANQRLTGLVISLPPEKQIAEVPSSFKTLGETILHMWNTESTWWQRMKMVEHVIPPGKFFTGSIADTCEGLMKQSMKWNNWVMGASAVALDHVFAYQNTKKEQFKQPVYQVLLHVFNHSTYHRGQIVNMLRQLEIDKIPTTDFIEWSRRK